MENLQEEIWKDVVGYEGIYQVSNLGYIKSISRRIRYTHAITGNEHFRLQQELILNQYKSKRGRLFVQLKNKNTSKNITVHRIVATAFIPNPMGLPEVNHIDGNFQNNRLSNLEWCTSLHNRNHAIQNSLYVRGSQCSQSKLTERDIKAILKINADGVSFKKIASYFEVSKSSIIQICQGKTWKHAQASRGI